MLSLKPSVLAAAPDLFTHAAALFAPVANGGPLALAVSGGSDSVALMHVAAAWQQRPGLTVLTIDHGLRAESAAEAQQVHRWSAALGLQHIVLRWDGAKPATAIQAMARAARYDLMSNWCKAHGVAWLLTAHTLDDQAETVLMRLARTSSIDSLAGIPTVGRWDGVGLFRPLLSLRREALRAALLARGVPWIDDPSNADERFERVRIRQALPLLAALGVSAERLAGHAAELRAIADGLWRAAGDWVTQHVRVHREGFCEVPLADLLALPHALRGRSLALLVERFGAGRLPDAGERALLSEWSAAEGSPRRTLAGAVLARRMRQLLIGREAGRILPGPAMIPDAGEIIWDRRFRVRGPVGSAVQAAVQVRPPNPPDGVPAFVRAAMPAIRAPGGAWAFAQLNDVGGAAAQFIS